MIPVNMPQIGSEEVESVVKVLRSRVLTDRLGNGPMVKKFEKAYARFIRAKHAVAVNNGTAALHLALLAAGVNSGNEVILPSFTFVATAEVVAMIGAKPVFVDINPETYNIDPQKIEEAVTAKSKAIIPVDLYGLPADMEAIKEVAQKSNLIVIEDAAQAHGATYKGKPPGYFADVACWSFYATKNMTTGEGGMVTTNDDDYAEKLRCVRSHGEKEEYRSFMIGYNYRMPEIEAAIGYAQLRKLPGFLRKRRENARLLTEGLAETKRLQLPTEPRNYKHSWYLYTVRLRDADSATRNNVVDELRKRGIGAAVYYPTPIHLMPYYRQFGEHPIPKTERAAQQVFSLPVHPGVTPKEIKYIGDSVKQVLK